jgi:ankyrin repeat protein
VDLQLKVLYKQRRDKDIEEELQRLPRDMDETYRRILDQINHQDSKLQLLAKNILTWVFYARNPLSIKALVEAVAIDDTCITKQDLQQNAYSIDTIFEVCANLLTVESSIVRPIHYSVQEYFTNPRNYDGNTTLRYLSDKELAYTHLAKCCIWYMLLDTFATGPCKNETEFDDRVNDYHLASHSTYYFDHYVIQLDDVSLELKEIIDDLLHGRGPTFASILQLRRLRDNASFSNIDAAFTKFKDDVLPEDIIYATALFESLQLQSINDRWKTIQPPRHALHRAAGAGTLNAVARLLKGGQLASVQDDNGITPLYYACEAGHIAISQLLVEYRANVNARGGYYESALQAASAGGHLVVVKMLLKSGADVNARGGHYESALQAASAGGHLVVIELLLEAGADVNAQGGYYRNALQAASLGGYQAVVELLLEAGADVNARGGYYGNALQVASTGGYRAVVELLLEAGANVDANGGEYGNALHAASLGGYQAVVELLLEVGADVNTPSGYYGNALQAASTGGHQAVVELLLEAGADVNAQGGHYGNALQAASAGGHHAVVELLLQNGAVASNEDVRHT